MSFVWSQQLVEEVAVYLKEGWSASQIGAQIGTSRNAVIGKVGRDKQLRAIGLGGNGPRTQKKSDATKVQRAVQRAKADNTTPPKLKVVKFQPTIIPESEFHVAGRPLMALGANDCRWVINDPGHGETFLFCGVNTERGSYCEHHNSIRYVRKAA